MSLAGLLFGEEWVDKTEYLLSNRGYPDKRGDRLVDYCQSIIRGALLQYGCGDYPPFRDENVSQSEQTRVAHYFVTRSRSTLEKSKLRHEFVQYYIECYPQWTRALALCIGISDFWAWLLGITVQDFAKLYHDFMSYQMSEHETNEGVFEKMLTKCGGVTSVEAIHWPCGQWENVPSCKYGQYQLTFKQPVFSLKKFIEANGIYLKDAGWDCQEYRHEPVNKVRPLFDAVVDYLTTRTDSKMYKNRKFQLTKYTSRETVDQILWECAADVMGINRINSFMRFVYSEPVEVVIPRALKAVVLLDELYRQIYALSEH